MADGPHVFHFSADDAAGNSTSRDLSFVLDTRAPVLSITSLNENDPLTERNPSTGTIDIKRLTGTVDGTGSSIVRLSYAFNGAPEMPFLVDVATGAFDTVLDISHLAIGPHTLHVAATDARETRRQVSFG